MDDKIKNAFLFPILKAIINEVELPSSTCVLHHLQIGNKTLYFEDDDILFLYQILNDMEREHQNLKKAN